MSDEYWDRLRGEMIAMAQKGPDSPYVAYADPELRAQIESPVDGEADYLAPSPRVWDSVVSTSDVDVPIRIYLPEADVTGRPMLVWMHGGGWAAGDLDGPEGDATAREVAVRADAVVISVDYRLAVDGVHYPVPLDDVIAAFRWARANAASLGADPDRISLGGASAGGNLAAGATLRLRDEGEQLPATLVMAYPALHPLYPEPSADLAAKLARMNPFASDNLPMRLMAENYIGGSAEHAPAYAMPGLADDLSGLPPTYIFNDDYDGIRASGERFAAQLRSAGVDVVDETVAGVGHGHLARPGLAQSAQSHRALARWVGARAISADESL